MIHPSAVIHPDAKLGADVAVGPLAVIESGVTVEEGASIHGQATLRTGTWIGKGTEVHPHAVIGGDPQDLTFSGAPSGVRVGAGCVLREHVTIHRATAEGQNTVIGDGCFLMNSTHVAHDVQLGCRVLSAGSAQIGGHAHIDDGTFLSGNVMVHQFVRIGRLVMAGGGAGITQDVPPFVLLRPCSLNVTDGINRVGLKRAGLSVEDRKAIKEAFRLLYRSELNTQEAVARIRSELDAPPALEMADFAEQAKRGICGKTHK